MSELRLEQAYSLEERNVVAKNDLSGDKLYKKLKAYNRKETRDEAAVSVMGAAWDIGAPIFGSSWGPLMYNQASRIADVIESTLYPPHFYLEKDHVADPLALVSGMSRLCLKLAHQVSKAVKQHKKIAVIGGDHSCAIGTWHGVADALGRDDSMGLIWIDAHLDANTPDTTRSGKLHGMPLAVLLGYGNENLVNLLARAPVIRPPNVAVVGVRSVEEGELNLLRGLGVRIYFMPEIEQRGLDTVLTEAQKIATSGSEHFGISIDLDVIDPLQAPGVNTHEAEGLNVNSLLKGLQIMHQYHGFLGVEIAEFNPLNDVKHRTVQVMDQLLECLLPELLVNYKQEENQFRNATLLQGGCS